MYSFSAGSKNDFVLLITRQFFIWGSHTFELEKHCKQYR